jgi:hypothetical protein
MARFNGGELALVAVPLDAPGSFMAFPARKAGIHVADFLPVLL